VPHSFSEGACSRLSPRLLAESASSGFRPEMLEKVIHLLGLLEGFTRHARSALRKAVRTDFLRGTARSLSNGSMNSAA